MQDNLVAEKTSILQKVLTLVFVWMPPVVLLWCILRGWSSYVDRLSIVLFVIFTAVSGFGVTIGFHRHFTHGSFKTYSFIRYIFVVLGSFAVQKNPLEWVAFHRVHHQHSDQVGDPHSPHTHGGGWWGSVRGFYHAHMGWFSKKLPNQEHYIKDLLKDRGLVLMSNLFLVWVAVGLLLPGVIAFLVTGSVRSAVLGFVWGGVIRLGFVYHLTWSVNSICHIWGTRRFNTKDESRNNWILGPIGCGEGWHNNHHAIQTSARHGLVWYELDPSWWIIRFMKSLRLVWDVRVPTREEIARLRGKLNTAI